MSLLVFQPTEASSLSSGGVGGSADGYSACQTDSGREGAVVVDRRSGESTDWVLAALTPDSVLALALLPMFVVPLFAAAGFRDKKRETDDGLPGTEPWEARRLRYFLFPGDDASCCTC